MEYIKMLKNYRSALQRASTALLEEASAINGSIPSETEDEFIRVSEVIDSVTKELSVDIEYFGEQETMKMLE